MYMSYADVLENYLIAEEGILDVAKKIGSSVFKGILIILESIKKAITNIGSKIRTLMNYKSKKAESNQTITKLLQENNQLKEEIRNLHRQSTQNENSRKEVDELMKKLKENEKTITELKNENSGLRANNDYTNFVKVAMAFIAHTSQQINKANTIMPKFFSDLNKYKDNDDDELIDHYINNYEENIPNENSGSWSGLYENLNKYLVKIEKDRNYLAMNGTEKLFRGLLVMNNQASKTITFLEDFVKKNQNGNNTIVAKGIRKITKKGGFIEMLRDSINISNKILNLYSVHGISVFQTVHGAI